LQREGLLERDDPMGEIARIIAGLRQQPSAMTQWDAITQLAKKLPSEVMEGTDPISLDPQALQSALEEAEELLFARLAALEAV
jgi:hypothetical protein